jgi:hypothetical protein
MVSILKYLNLHDRNDRLLIQSLIIFTYIIILYFVSLILMFFVSLFNETKIIEGNKNWFKSDAQKRREARRAREEMQERINMHKLCMEPTAANFIACGPNYFFPDSHLRPAMEASTKAYEEKLKSGKQVNKGITTDLSKTLKR